MPGLWSWCALWAFRRNDESKATKSTKFTKKKTVHRVKREKRARSDKCQPIYFFRVFRFFRGLPTLNFAERNHENDEGREINFNLITAEAEGGGSPWLRTSIER